MSLFYHDRLVAGLKTLGFKEDYSSRSAKYTCLVHPTNAQSKYFVGRNGALRAGKCATQSYSVGDPSRQTPTFKLLFNGEILAARYFIRHPEEKE